MIDNSARFAGSFAYLISSGNNPKTIKSDKGGVYLTAILNLKAGSAQVCPWATTDCIDACLDHGGNPAYAKGKERARAARTALFFNDRPEFMRRLRLELQKHIRKAARLGVKPAFRPNGTSDLTWETLAPEIFDEFKSLQVYDYTKGAHRLTSEWKARKMPANYDLTLSYSGANWAKCETALNQGGRVAVCFGGLGRTKPFPKFWRGFPVHDGDVTDLTFTRPTGILGLRAKGKARNAYLSRFVVWDHDAVGPRYRKEYENAVFNAADSALFAPIPGES